MQTAELKIDWNRRAAAFTDPEAGVRRNLLAPLLRFAAVNAPVADTANLFRLLETVPAAQGTLVPDRHAPPGLNRLDVFVRVSRAGARVVSPAATGPAQVAPVPAPSAVLPESFRAALKSLGAESLDAAEILSQVSEDETVADYDALRAAAAGVGAVAELADASPADALRELEAAGEALVRARAANELASFVLGNTGDDLAQRMAELVVQAKELRDRPMTFASGRSPVPPAPVIPAGPAPEWEAQRWADLTPCLSAAQIRSRVDDRRQTIARAGLPEALEESLAHRLPDPGELAAAVQVATFMVEVAGGAEGGELPTTLAPERMGEVLAAGVDAAVGWLRPILRANAERLAYGDCSWMEVVPTLENARPVAGRVASQELDWEALTVRTVADFLAGADLHRTDAAETLGQRLRPVLPAGELPLLASHAVKWFAALHPTTKAPLLRSHLAGGEELQTWVKTVVDDTRVVSAINPAEEDGPEVKIPPAAMRPAAETVLPVPIDKGDWIEWDASNGETRRGQVEAVWQVGPLIPGQKCIPHDEYSVENYGVVRPEQRPRRVTGSLDEAATVAAEFLATHDAASSEAEVALAARLMSVLPAEEVPRAARRVLVMFALDTPSGRAELLNEHRAGGVTLARWVQTVLDQARHDQGIDDRHEARLRARIEAGDETARPELDRVEAANTIVTDNTTALLRQIETAEATVDPNAPDLDELDAEAAAEDASTLAVPPFVPVEPEAAGEEPAEVSALELHAGHFRAWFLSTPARDRLEATPWNTALGSGVNPADFVLVADVRGAHAHEVFARLQNGLTDWADGTDPGAAVRVNLDAADGRLRRRSMDFGDLVENVETGECRLVGPDDLMPLNATATEVGLTLPGSSRWQPVPVLSGFPDPLEPREVEAEEAADQVAVAGAGRGRRR